jgi:hypothetical protein
LRGTPFEGCSCIFVERENREERGRALRRETTFAGGENASQGKQQAWIMRQQTTFIISPYSMDLRGRTTFIVHRNRGEQHHGFLESLACIPRLSYSTFQAQKLRKVLGTIFWVKKIHTVVWTCTEKEGHTARSLGTIFKVLGMFFKAFAKLGFPYSCSRYLACKPRTICTTFNAVTVVQWYGFLVQKSRSKLQECPDQFVKFMKMNML